MGLSVAPARPRTLTRARGFFVGIAMSYVELAEPKQVTTRKRTHCAWCGETIPKGAGGIWTRHYVFEAGPQTDHMHPECWAALHQMDRAEISCGWAVGDFIRGTVEWA